MHAHSEKRAGLWFHISMKRAAAVDYAAQLADAAEAAIASFDEASKKSKTCAVSAAKKVFADMEKMMATGAERLESTRGEVKLFRDEVRTIQQREKSDLSALTEQYKAKAKAASSDALRKLHKLSSSVRGEDESDVE